MTDPINHRFGCSELMEAIRARMAEFDVPLNVAADIDQLMTEAPLINVENEK